MMSDNAEAPKEHFSCLPRSDCNALYYAFQRKKNKTTKGRFKKRIDFQFIIFWKFLNIKMVGGGGGVNP